MGLELRLVSVTLFPGLIPLGFSISLTLWRNGGHSLGLANQRDLERSFLLWAKNLLKCLWRAREQRLAQRRSFLFTPQALYWATYREQPPASASADGHPLESQPRHTQGYPYLQLPASQSLYITFLSHLLTVATWPLCCSSSPSGRALTQSLDTSCFCP